MSTHLPGFQSFQVSTGFRIKNQWVKILILWSVNSREQLIPSAVRAQTRYMPQPADVLISDQQAHIQRVNLNNFTSY